MHHAAEPSEDASKLTAQQQADLIDTLKAITSLDEKENEKSKAIFEFLFKSIQKFDTVMQIHDSWRLPASPAPFDGKGRQKFQAIEPITANKAEILYQNIRTKESGDQSEEGNPPLGSKIFVERFRKMKNDQSQRPNTDQQNIIDKYTLYFDELLSFRANLNLPASTLDPQSVPPPPTPPLMFLHAEGGAGKSFIAKFLQCAADSYGFGHLSTAVMGVACNNLGNAVTIDSILRPRRPCVKNDSEENQGYANLHLPKLSLLSPALVAKMHQQIKGKALLIIDELSILGPASFALLDQHLRETLDDERPF
jgi:hypothetical protein